MISLSFQRRSCFLALILSLSHPITGRAQQVKRQQDITALPSRVAFGSCSDQEKPQPLLRDIAGLKPDLFIYLGDNIYGDTEDMVELSRKYAELAAKPEFQVLRATVPTLAIWDDHDYGANDAGLEYPKKEESKAIFMNFWRVPQDSSRRKHPGIYHSHSFSKGGRTLQIILLDTRTFRSPLATNTVPSWKNDYHPDTNPDKTLLGEAQWKWLAEELSKPADVRVIASSIQFGHQHNGWESWTNLPHELLKMLSTIRETKADGVVFISGDVHWGEISVLEVEDLYPIHDVTSSGLTQDWDSVEPNQNRHGPVVRENNFGQIEIDWDSSDPIIALSIVDNTGTTRVIKRVPLSSLKAQ
ncbi:MAG: alkaline phosphatase D [Verrucomicrobiales bacterium]|jgi:alkaline phosphatase D